MRKEITVKISNPYLNYRSLRDIVEEFQEILENNKLYRDIELVLSSFYDSIECEIWGKRLETDIEMKNRLDKEKQQKEQRRQQFEELKKEFENE